MSCSKWTWWRLSSHNFTCIAWSWRRISSSACFKTFLTLTISSSSFSFRLVKVSRSTSCWIMWSFRVVQGHKIQVGHWGQVRLTLLKQGWIKSLIWKFNQKRKEIKLKTLLIESESQLKKRTVPHGLHFGLSDVLWYNLYYIVLT